MFGIDAMGGQACEVGQSLLCDWLFVDSCRRFSHHFAFDLSITNIPLFYSGMYCKFEKPVFGTLCLFVRKTLFPVHKILFPIP